MKYHTFIVGNLSKKTSEEIHKAFKGYHIYSARISSGFGHRVPCAMVTLVGDFNPKDIEKAYLVNSAGQKLTVEHLTTQVRDEPEDKAKRFTSSPMISRLK